MRRILSLLVLLAALATGPTAHAWIWPAAGPVLRPFSLGSDPYAGGQHRGVDIGAELGSQVVAPAAGTVSFAGSIPGSGRAVTIQTPDGYAVTLLQLGSTSVSSGSVVTEGAVVGVVGASVDAVTSAPHVHLGVRIAARSGRLRRPARLAPALVLQPLPAPPSEPVPPSSKAPRRRRHRPRHPSRPRPRPGRLLRASRVFRAAAGGACTGEAALSPKPRPSRRSRFRQGHRSSKRGRPPFRRPCGRSLRPAHAPRGRAAGWAEVAVKGSSAITPSVRATRPEARPVRDKISTPAQRRRPTRVRPRPDPVRSEPPIPASRSGVWPATPLAQQGRRRPEAGGAGFGRGQARSRSAVGSRSRPVSPPGSGASLRLS